MRIVIVGDMHCGSLYGLAHSSDVPENKSNAFIKWVFESWMDFTQKYNEPDYLILIGDLADGSQVKTLGVDALSTDLDEQVNMANVLLRMIVPVGSKTKIYGVNGSGYHGGEGQATNVDRRIIESVNGEYKGNIFEFEIGDEKIQVNHGSSGAIMAVHAYILREINLSKTDAQKRKTKGPTILLRGHQHRMFAIQDDAGIWGILNGCWQYTTPFMSKRSANVSPSIGATIIDIDRGKTKIYREEYPIPEFVRMEMCGFEKLSKSRSQRNKENLKVLKESLKDRKF